MKKISVPTNDEECKKLLKDVCRRTDEQADAIIQFGKLAKELMLESL